MMIGAIQQLNLNMRRKMKMKIMNKEKFLNDLHECINGYWDSFPPEIQDDFNAVYDKHNEENDAEEDNE